MINAWSLAYDVLNGTLDENFPIKEKPMTDEIKLTGADEGVVNVPKGLEYHDPTHYVDEQGDLHLATSKDDFKVDTTSEKKVFNVSCYNHNTCNNVQDDPKCPSRQSTFYTNLRYRLKLWLIIIS